MKKLILLLLFSAIWARPIPDDFMTSERLKQYQADLGRRFSLNPGNRTVGRKLIQAASLNADFNTALQTTRKLFKGADQSELKQLKFTEIRTLRYAHRINELLPLLDLFLKEYGGTAEAKQLSARYDIIKRSAALKKAQLNYQDFDTGKVQPATAYALMAPNLVFVRSHSRAQLVKVGQQKASLVDYGLPTDLKSAQDLEIFHKEKDSPYAYKRSDDTYLVAGQSKYEIEILTDNNCDFPGFSPWYHYVIAACRTDNQFDLKVFMRQNERWQAADIRSLKEINTQFDEISPRISADGRWLFFASNGHPGFAGFDIYASQISYKDGALVLAKPLNLKRMLHKR